MDVDQQSERLEALDKQEVQSFATKYWRLNVVRGIAGTSLLADSLRLYRLKNKAEESPDDQPVDPQTTD